MPCISSEVKVCELSVSKNWLDESIRIVECMLYDLDNI